MADQDCNKMNFPLALSSSTPSSWWDHHHHATRPTPSKSSWNNTGLSAVNLWESHNNANSTPCDKEDVSISASNHSSLTVDESSHRFIEPSFSSNNIITTDHNSHLWSQLLLGVGDSQEMHSDEMGENLLNALSSKGLFSGGLFEPPACGDHLKKLFDSHHHDKWADNNGDQYPNSNTNGFFTNNGGYNGDNLIEKNDQHRSLMGLSTTNSWPIAPTNQSQMIHHLIPHPCNNNTPSIDQYLHPDMAGGDETKRTLAYPRQLFDMGRPNSSFDCANSGLGQMRLENAHHGESDEVGSSPATLFPKALFISNNESGYRPVGASWRPGERNMPSSQHGFTSSSSVIDPFNNSGSRLLSKPLPKPLSLLDARKPQGTLSNSSMNKGNNWRGQGPSTNEGKKRRSDDTSSSMGNLKKPKHESSSNPSSAKTPNTQTPKVKNAAEKISALQQIVSPYGKTDTASVLQEALVCIRRLQDNVQLLSNPYLRSSANKLQEAWGSLDRKFEKGERNKVLDLRSKGLCLIPISSIPQDIKEDNSGIDYWPAYRSCLYR
ncbi:hypothetical protein QQ045_015891 [Rhodiola kirilowii]